MKMRQKFFGITMAVILVVSAFAGCKSDSGAVVTNEGTKGQLAQFSDPVKGQTIATIKVKDYGDIQLMLFPKAAPKGVENFVTHAKEGYYNGVTFHRIVSDFMIQGGDPDGTGAGGQSIWGKDFGVEYDGTLRNFTGAIAYANTGEPESNGSQFFIVNGPPVTAEQMEQIKVGYPDVEFPDEVVAKYEEVGGSPFLDSAYTVFGQVIEGMDVVQKIMETETDWNTFGTEQSVPVTPVVIDTITISEYAG